MKDIIKIILTAAFLLYNMPNPAYAGRCLRPVSTGIRQNDTVSSGIPKTSATGFTPIAHTLPEGIEELGLDDLVLAKKGISDIISDYIHQADVISKEYGAYKSKVQAAIESGLGHGRLQEAEEFFELLYQRFHDVVSALSEIETEINLLLEAGERMRARAEAIQRQRREERASVGIFSKRIRAIADRINPGGAVKRAAENADVDAKIDSLIRFTERLSNGIGSIRSSRERTLSDFSAYLHTFARPYFSAAEKALSAIDRNALSQEDIDAFNQAFIDKIVMPEVTRIRAEEKTYGQNIAPKDAEDLIEHLGKSFDSLLYNLPYDAPDEAREKAERLRHERDALHHSLSNLAGLYAPCRDIPPNDIYRNIINTLNNSGPSERIELFRIRLLHMIDDTIAMVKEAGGETDYLIRNARTYVADLDFTHSAEEIAEDIIKTKDIRRWHIVRESPYARKHFSPELLDSAEEALFALTVRNLYADHNHESWDKTANIYMLGELRHPESIWPLFICAMQGGHSAAHAMSTLAGLLSDEAFMASLPEDVRVDLAPMADKIDQGMERLDYYTLAWEFTGLAQRAVVSGLCSDDPNYRAQAVNAAEGAPSSTPIPLIAGEIGNIIETGHVSEFAKFFERRLSCYDPDTAELLYSYLNKRKVLSRNVVRLIIIIGKAFASIDESRKNFPEVHSEMMEENDRYKLAHEKRAELRQLIRRFAPLITGTSPVELSRKGYNMQDVIEASASLLLLTGDNSCRDYIIGALNNPETAHAAMRVVANARYAVSIGPDAVAPMVQMGWGIEDRGYKKNDDLLRNYLRIVLKKEAFAVKFKEYLNTYFEPHGLDITGIVFQNEHVLLNFASALERIGKNEFSSMGLDPKSLYKWLSQHMDLWIRLTRLYSRLKSVFGAKNASAIVADIVRRKDTFAVSPLEQVPFYRFSVEQDEENMFAPVINYMKQRLSAERQVAMLIELGQAANMVAAIDKGGSRQLTAQCFSPVIRLAEMSQLEFALEFIANGIREAAEPLEELFDGSESERLRAIVDDVHTVLAKIGNDGNDGYVTADGFIYDVEELLERTRSLGRRIDALPEIRHAFDEKKRTGAEYGRLKGRLSQEISEEERQEIEARLTALQEEQRPYQELAARCKAAKKALKLGYLSSLANELKVQGSALSQAVEEQGFSAVTERLESEFVPKHAERLSAEIRAVNERVISSFLSENEEAPIIVPHGYGISQELNNLIYACYSARSNNVLRDGIRSIVRTYILESPRAALERVYSPKALVRLRAFGYQNTSILLEGLSLAHRAEPPADIIAERERRLRQEREEVVRHIERDIGIQLEELAQEAGVDAEEALNSDNLDLIYGVLTDKLGGAQDDILADIHEHIENMRSIESEQIADIKGPQDVGFYLSNDLIEESNMGVGFPSCLGLLTGGNRHSAIVNAFEPQPIVLYARNKKGSRIGRLLVLMTDRGLLVHREYKSTSLNLAPGWFTLLSKLSAAFGMPVVIPANAAMGISGMVDELKGRGLTPSALANNIFKVDMYRFSPNLWYNDIGHTKVTRQAGFELHLSGQAYVFGRALRDARQPVEDPGDVIVTPNIETRFDLRIGTFSNAVSISSIRAAESYSDIHMIRVDRPSGEQISKLIPEGYFHRTARVRYVLKLPPAASSETAAVDEAMDGYYARFKSKRRRQFKKDVSGIDERIAGGQLELVIDKGRSGKYIRDFVSLYDREMSRKARGRKPMLDYIESNDLTPQEFLGEGRMGVYLRRNGRIVSGIIVSKRGRGYSISYAATDHEAMREIRGMHFYLLQYMIRKSIEEGEREEGEIQLSYGVDTNLYGHHLGTGLMRFKISAGFRPHAAGIQELIKITDFSMFDFPAFFYSLGRQGELQSNLILNDEFLHDAERAGSVIRGFEGATDTLNIYAYTAGQLIQTTKEAVLSGKFTLPSMKGSDKPKTAATGIAVQQPAISTGAELVRSDIIASLQAEAAATAGMPKTSATGDIVYITEPLCQHLEFVRVQNYSKGEIGRAVKAVSDYFNSFYRTIAGEKQHEAEALKDRKIELGENEEEDLQARVGSLRRELWQELQGVSLQAKITLFGSENPAGFNQQAFDRMLLFGLPRYFAQFGIFTRIEHAPLIDDNGNVLLNSYWLDFYEVERVDSSSIQRLRGRPVTAKKLTAGRRIRIDGHEFYFPVKKAFDAQGAYGNIIINPARVTEVADAVKNAGANPTVQMLKQVGIDQILRSVLTSGMDPIQINSGMMCVEAANYISGKRGKDIRRDAARAIEYHELEHVRLKEDPNARFIPPSDSKRAQDFLRAYYYQQYYEEIKARLAELRYAEPIYALLVINEDMRRGAYDRESLMEQNNWHKAASHYIFSKMVELISKNPAKYGFMVIQGYPIIPQVQAQIFTLARNHSALISLVDQIDNMHTRERRRKIQSALSGSSSPKAAATGILPTAEPPLPSAVPVGPRKNRGLEYAIKSAA